MLLYLQCIHKCTTQKNKQKQIQISKFSSAYFSPSTKFQILKVMKAAKHKHTLTAEDAYMKHEGMKCSAIPGYGI